MEWLVAVHGSNHLRLILWTDVQEHIAAPTCAQYLSTKRAGRSSDVVHLVYVLVRDSSGQASAIDVFMCGDCEPRDALPGILEYYEPTRHEIVYLNRGKDDADGTFYGSG